MVANCESYILIMIIEYIGFDKVCSNIDMMLHISVYTSLLVVYSYPYHIENFYWHLAHVIWLSANNRQEQKYIIFSTHFPLEVHSKAIVRNVFI